MLPSILTKTLFSWYFDILYNIFTSPTDIPAIQDLQSSTPVGEFKLTLCLNFQHCLAPSDWIPPHQTSVLLIYLLKSFSNFCNNQIVVSITVSSPERLDIKYTSMPSPIYQDVINLTVSFPTMRSLSVFITVLIQECHALTKFLMWQSRFL